MIKNFFVTGDMHGGANAITRVSNIAQNNPKLKPEETGIIILGDSGLNFYLNKTDKKYKQVLNDMGFKIYCVRGNHEQRPELIPTMTYTPDDNLGSMVWGEPDFPNIKYLLDGECYTFGKYRALVIGGAYSIDKWYRLARAGIYNGADAKYANPKQTGWFPDEMLTDEEMTTISRQNANNKFDFVLSHTCPLSWEPTDLFLNFVDQTTVNKSMEIWMDDLKDKITWNIWLFGHFHADRIERPHVEQMYQSFTTLDDIWNRWNGKNTYPNEWWLDKSPYMEMWDQENDIMVRFKGFQD